MALIREAVSKLRVGVFILAHFKTFCFVRKYRTLNSERIFRAAWRKLNKSRPGIFTENNRYNIRHIDRLHFQFRHGFKYFFPHHVPRILTSQTSESKVTLPEPRLIVTVHSFNEFAICKLLENAGKRVAFVSYDPNSASEISNYSFREPPQNIAVTPQLFLELRSVLKDGRSVVIDVDFVVQKWLAAKQHLVTSAVFTFQKLTNTKLLFAAAEIEKNGGIVVSFEAPDAGSKNNAAEVATKFIEFVGRIQGRSMDLKIGDWSALTADKSKRYSSQKRRDR